MARANWHLPAIEADTTDPFAPTIPAPTKGPTVKSEALPQGSVSDEAFAELRELVRAEGRLADQGKTCHLKDRTWTVLTCQACPERGSRGALCGIGVAQEKLLNGG